MTGWQVVTNGILKALLMMVLKVSFPIILYHWFTIYLDVTYYQTDVHLGLRYFNKTW